MPETRLLSLVRRPARLLSCLCCLLCLPAVAASQISIRGGLSRATMQGAPSGFGARTSPALGFGVGFGAGPVVVRPELLYVGKVAARLAAPGVPTDFGYLEAPVLIEWSPATGLPFVALAGGYLARRVRCIGGGCTDGIREWDHGLVVGAGARTSGTPSLGVELRADLGLASLYRDGGSRRTTRALLLLGSLTL